MANENNLLSFRAYAKKRKVSPQSVSNAVNSGRLKESVKQIDGKKFIDPILADDEWQASTKEEYKPNKFREKTNEEKFVNSVLPEDATKYEFSKFFPNPAPPLRVSREQGEYHKARLVEIECEIKLKNLLPAKEVEKVWTNILTNFKTKVMSIPSKASPQLTNIDAASEIEQILRRLVDEALLELSEYSADAYDTNDSK